MLNRLIIILLIGITFASCNTQKNELNTLQVVTENLDLNTLQIYWTTEKGFADREGEQDSVLVFTEGEYLKNIGKVYGGNGFYVYCEGNYIGNGGHFKTRNSDTYEYTLEVNKVDSISYSIKFMALGIDTISSERIFSEGKNNLAAKSIEKYLKKTEVINTNYTPIAFEKIRNYEFKSRSLFSHEYSIDGKKTTSYFLLSGKYLVEMKYGKDELSEYIDNDGVDIRFFSSKEQEGIADNNNWEMFIIQNGTISIVGGNTFCFQQEDVMNSLNCISDSIDWNLYSHIEVCESLLGENCIEKAN